MRLRRLIDIVVGLCCLTLAAPGMVLIAILIRRDSPGPVLYVPKMVGWNGALFPLFRFRTMRSGDFTPVGHFIRTYSLDHLPVLFNLLLGHITLVGPRPMEADVVDLRDATWQAYVRVKPGVINYAVLALGREWTPSRTQQPDRNQALELSYLQRRGWRSDSVLVGRAVRALIASRGNIKARKPPDEVA